MDNKINNFIKITPIFLIIAGAILKLMFISSNSIGGDEPFSIFHAQLNVSSIIHQLSTGNNPPLYEILLHFWIKLFGISELSVRMPSLIFNVIAAYFIYKTGKEFFTFQIALIASLLFTFSNYHILFSHEARVYSLFALLTAMSMYYFFALTKLNNDLKYYSLLLLTNVTLLYSHYFGFFVIILQTIALLSLKDIRQKKLKTYLIYILILILLYVPNIAVLITRFLDSSAHGTWVQSPDGFESIYDMLWQFSNKPLATVISIVILVIAFIKSIIKRDIKYISENNKVILIWFLFPFFSMFSISYWIPMFLDRYLVFVSLGYYILLAISASYIIQQGKFRVIIPILLVIAFIGTFNPNIDNKRHVKETVEKIKELKDNNIKVLICPQDFIYNFTYYYNMAIFKDVNNSSPYSGVSENLKKENVFTINNIKEIDLSDSKKVIFLDAASQFSFPDNNIMSTLIKTYKLINTYKYYEIFNVYEFVKQ